jgi:hypothetical protein
MSGEFYFHPHPFTDDSTKTLARYCGKDLYYLLVDDNKVLAYGMLRGWDQGLRGSEPRHRGAPQSRREKAGRIDDAFPPQRCSQERRMPGPAKSLQRESFRSEFVHKARVQIWLLGGGWPTGRHIRLIKSPFCLGLMAQTDRHHRYQ